MTLKELLFTKKHISYIGIQLMNKQKLTGEKLEVGLKIQQLHPDGLLI